MKRTIRRCSPQGDTLVAEYDIETVTKERLADIEREYNEIMQNGGMIAFNVTNHVDEQIHNFKPDTDIMMVPQIVGG